MFCAFCGKEISDSSRFCPFCGGGVNASAAPAAPQPQFQSAPAAGVKKKKMWPIVLGSVAGGLALVAILGVLAFHFLLPKLGLYGDFDDIMDEAGEAYEYEEDVEKAEKLLGRAYRAAADDSEKSEVWQARGIIAYLEGDTDEAAKHLRKAIDLDAWTAELYLMLATCHLDMGDEDTAFDVLLEGLEVYPYDGGIENMLWEEFDYEVESSAQAEPAPQEPQQEEMPAPEAPGELPDMLRVLLADSDPMFDLGLTLGFEMGYGMGMESEVSSVSDAYETLFMLEAGEADVLIISYTPYDCENYGFPDYIYTDPICDWGGLEYCMILRPDSAALRDELNVILRDYKESGYLAEVLEANLPDATVVW